MRPFGYSAAVKSSSRLRAATRPSTSTVGGPDGIEGDGSHRVLETAAGAALVAGMALAAIVGCRVGAAIDGPAAVALVIAAALAGVLACDLAAGVVHWACDTFFRETTPILGPALIAPFREHHRDPLAMTCRSFLDVNSSNFFGVLPLLAYAAWRDVTLAGNAPALFGHACLLAFAAAAVLTNQFHKWAHAPAVPALVRRLQRAHLVLPPRAHARHHRASHGSAFCVTGGWLNPLLDRLDFFGRLERAIRAGRDWHSSSAGAG